MAVAERIALTAWAVVLEGLDLLGFALRLQRLSDFANAQWAVVMKRLDASLNGPDAG